MHFRFGGSKNWIITLSYICVKILYWGLLCIFTKYLSINGQDPRPLKIFFQFEHFWTVLDLGSSLVIKFYYKLSWILTTYAVLFIIGYFTINGYYKASSTVNHIDWLILEMFRVDEFFYLGRTLYIKIVHYLISNSKIKLSWIWESSGFFFSIWIFN